MSRCHRPQFMRTSVSATRPLLASAVVLAGAFIAPATAAGQEPTDAANRVEEVTIIGTREDARQITGSAHFVGLEDIERLGHTDVQRILRQVPGVSIQVEDGYGLRPNISIRGVATERSGRITLLEDNVLIAPAPYSAPSAYYFPTIARMNAIEVLKGPAAISQGPYTIGGALNMVSTPIPEFTSGRVVAEAGEDATYRLHATWGTTTAAGFGMLLETHQWQSDGFQDIDRGGDSGLDVEDYTLKLAYAPLDSRHRVELKLQYADQDSDQSYLGLTDADFADDGFRRYGISALDNITTEHQQQILRYQFDLTEDTSFSVTAYNNEHERSWFKTEGIDFDGSADAETFDRTSWFNVIQAINQGDAIGSLTPTALSAILDGAADTAPGSIQLRANDREYFSRGIQTRLDWEFTTGAARHALEIGVRWHEDEEDRLQRNSNYSQIDGVLALDDPGLLGNAGNRIQEAQALAIHVYDRIEFGRLTLTPGLRYEDIEQQRTRYEIRPGRTLDPSSRSAANIRDTRANDTRVWLPGMGIAWRASDELSLFGGVHKGFSAPTNAPGVNEETAINYELGARWQGGIYAEATLFMSDYDNLLGTCTASSGADCVVGDAFNGDAVTVRGLELLTSFDALPGGAWSAPVELSYTWVNAEFDTSIADTDFFGSVSQGDPVPYIPDHQANLSVGLERAAWGAYANLVYVDQVCVRASCDPFERTDASLTVDVSGNYQATQALNLFARIENLTGEEDIMGRQPYGARPNKDRTASVGLRFSF